MDKSYNNPFDRMRDFLEQKFPQVKLGNIKWPTLRRATLQTATAEAASLPPGQVINIPPPPKFDDIARESKDIQHMAQETHAGLKIDLSRSFGPQFTITHTASLGSSTGGGGPPQMQQQQEPPAKYDFLSFYAFPMGMIMGRVSTGGDMLCRAMTGVEDLTLSLGYNIQKGQQGQEASALEAELTASSPNVTVNLKAGQSSSPQGSNFVGIGSWCHRISPTLTLGIESTVNVLEPSASMGLALRHDWKHWTTLLLAHLNSSYEATVVRRVGPFGHFTASYMLGRPPYAQKPGMIPVFTLGYHMQLGPMLTARASVTNFKVIQAILEEKMSEQFGFSICGVINYPKNSYKFGYGVNFGL